MDKEDDFNEETAAATTSSMWLKLAHRFSDEAFLTSDTQDALKLAMIADACYWQATGTNEPISLRDFI